MTIYDSHLRRLGFILIALRVFLLLFYVLTVEVFHVVEAQSSLPIVVGKAVISVAMAAIAFIIARKKHLVKYTIVCSVMLTIAMIALLVLDSKNPDSLIDMSLLLIIMVFSLQVQIRKRTNLMLFIQRSNPTTLDLRITGKADLFDPLVIGPHVEPNANLIGAIDHFLETSPAKAPLNLCFHSSEPISQAVRTTLKEVLQLHYQDEAKRVERFMESRYLRYIVLIVSSIIVLRALTYFSGMDTSSIMWVIFSNFAAFSLWQVGNTYFERAQAFEELVRFLIAKECEITFF